MIETDGFLRWCAQLFNQPLEQLSLLTPRSEIPGWDSMGSLLLMADLDELHGIVIDEEGMRELKTLGDLAALIEAQGVASE